MIPPTRRVHYFDHQFLRVDDFTDEQDYHLGMRRAHNRLLHSWGVAHGLTVSHAGSTVTVTDGVAIDGAGREVVLAHSTQVEVPATLAGKTAWLTLAYGERTTDPTVETGAAGDRRWEELPSLRLADAPPGDLDTDLVLGRLTIDTSGNVATRDDGEGASRRRVAGPAPITELNVSLLTVGGAAGDAPLHLAGGRGDLTAGEGDLKVGGATHRLKVGVTLTGTGAGDVRLRAQGGTGRLLLGSGTADVLAVQGGNVGIGTGTAPIPQQLTLTGALGFANFNAVDRRLYAPADGTLRWQTSSAAPTHALEVGLETGEAPIRLDPAGPSYLAGGSLGVGVSTVDATLHVAGGRAFATTDGDLKVGTGTNRLKVGVEVTGATAGTARLRAEGTAPKLVLGAAGADVLTVSGTGASVTGGLTVSTGRVAVGVTTASESIHASGNLRIDAGEIKSLSGITLRPDTDNTGDCFMKVVHPNGTELLSVASNGNATVSGRVSDAKLRTQAPISYNAISITNGANAIVWNNVPNMNLSLSGGTFLILFSMGGVEARDVTKATGDFRILVDGATQSAYTAESYHLGEWEARAVSLECLVTLAAGTHTVVAQWSVRSPYSPATHAKLVGCSYNDHRTLIAIEL